MIDPHSLTLGLTIGGSSLVTTTMWAVFHPRSQLFGRLVHRGPATSPRVALTFDDGPDPEVTPAILDQLGELRVRATFFVIGANAARAPALVRRMAAEGHDVGNHTFDHHRLGVLRGVRYWRAQIGRTQELIADLTGRPPLFLRPPLGFKTLHQRWAARSFALTHVSYSLRGLDGFATEPGRIVERIVPRAAGGDIIALHDGRDPLAGVPRPAARDALAPLVRGLRGRGLEPIALSQLLGAVSGPATPAPAPRATARASAPSATTRT